jgi:hypothetical protein
MEYNPRAVFERMFGDSGSTGRAARQARTQQRKSLLDAVTARLADIKRDVGRQDKVDKIGGSTGRLPIETLSGLAG